MKSTTQGKTRLFQLGAVISILISVSIYIWSLKGTWAADSYIVWASNRYGSIYILRFCYFLLSGLFCLFVWRISKNKIYVETLFILESILYCLLRTWLGYDLGYTVKELCLTLWPVFTYLLAVRLLGLKRKSKPVPYMVELVLYYIIFTVGIWVVQYRFVVSEFFRRNPVEMIYMLVIGILSWIVAVQSRSDLNKHKYSLIDRILPVMSCVFLFWNHDRILQIIGSLRNPFTSVATDNLVETNWIGYRFSLFSDAWFGNLSFLKMDWILEKLYRCPLFWIRYQKGWIPALIVMIMEFTLLYCIVMLVKNKDAGKNPLVKILLVSVLLYTVLGILADMFLITSADIGMPILRNPADILLVLYLVFGEYKIPVLLREEYEAESGGNADENVRYSYAHHSRGR